jgi:hypothetical protein
MADDSGCDRTTADQKGFVESEKWDRMSQSMGGTGKRRRMNEMKRMN